MDKLSIALNRNNQSLSNADFKLGIDNNYWNPIKDLQAEAKERRKRFITQIEQERKEDLEQLKKSYEFKAKKINNLGIAYNLLLGKNHDIDLIFTYDKGAFLEIVKEAFDDVELELLADNIYKLQDKLSDKINKIKSGDNLELYNQYHIYSKDFEEIDNQSNQPTSLAWKVQVPSNELIDMENERDIYIDLQSELEKLIKHEPELYSYSLERIRQALA